LSAKTHRTGYNSMKISKGFDIEWFNHVLIWSGVITVLVYVFMSVYSRIDWANGILVGSLWNIANLWLIKWLLVGGLVTPRKPIRQLLLGVLIKFPLLYGTGAWLMMSGQFPILSLMVGFHVPFAVIILKVMGRMLVPVVTGKQEITDIKE